MSLRHNKKRNVGLVYEFFSRYIGQAIMEHRDHDVAKARVLLKKHFNKGTDISRELYLFKLLFESKVSDHDRAVHLINRVRESVKLQSQTRLDLEKTGLIHEVNTNLGDNNFFNRNITEYKTYATIQMLMNSWRSIDLHESVGETVELESKLIDHLTRGTLPVPTSLPETMTEQDVDRLVVNIMSEKVNERYGSALSDEQKSIIQLYVFSDDTSSASALVSLLEQIKQRTHRAILSNVTEFSKDKVLTEKLNTVHSMLTTDYADTSKLNDDMISFYLGMSVLEKELGSNE